MSHHYVWYWGGFHRSVALHHSFSKMCVEGRWTSLKMCAVWVHGSVFFCSYPREIPEMFYSRLRRSRHTTFGASTCKTMHSWVHLFVWRYAVQGFRWLRGRSHPRQKSNLTPVKIEIFPEDLMLIHNFAHAQKWHFLPKMVVFPKLLDSPRKIATPSKVSTPTTRSTPPHTQRVG